MSLAWGIRSSCGKGEGSGSKTYYHCAYMDVGLRAFYLRRSRQIRERKALFFFLLLLLLGGGPFSNVPCTVF